MTEKIRVAVLGARGRMGSESVQAIHNADDMELVAALGSSDSLEEIIFSDAHVVLDFTTPGASFDNVLFAITNNRHVVVGTSGWGSERRRSLSEELKRYPAVGVLIAPNFAIGSVLATYFAEMAAPYFESVEVIELHHPHKADAPSGTAIRTAEGIAEARGKARIPAAPDATAREFQDARGRKVLGVPVHSVRLQGLVAHQEVLFGGQGEGLKIRHDSYDRKSFMPGILLGIRRVGQSPGLAVGLESYLSL